MRASHWEGRTPITRQLIVAMAAMTWLALLLPVGARAAGQLVTIADPASSSKARVDGGSLRVVVHNDPARTPVGVTHVINIPPAELVSVTRLTTVPAGYELVVESLSVFASVPQGQRLSVARIVYPGMQFFIPMSFMATEAGISDYYQGAQAVRLYVNPGDAVQAGFQRSATAGGVTVVITLSGHLVKL